MTAFRPFTALASFLSLAFILQLLTPSTHFAHAQTTTTLALLTNVTLYYNDNITATPPAFQSALYNATAAIFQGVSMNGIPGGTLGSATSGDLSIVRLNQSYAASTGAQCMDGSAYAYYIRRTTVAANAGKWLIYLQGGSLCVDPISCAQRSTTALGSSNGYQQYYTDNSNVISTVQSVNPQFYNWNIVALPYCSGDVWGGSATSNTTNPLFPYYFAGYNITLATINHLISTQNFSAATDIVLSGTSAGGIGVFVHVDNFAAAVPTARTVGYPQAGWFSVGLEFQQWAYGASAASATSTVPRPYYDSVLFQVLQPMFTTFNFVSNPACAAYFIGTLNQPLNITQCANMPVLYRFVRSPMFILENKFDAFQISYLNVVPLTAAYYQQTVNYLIYYGQQMITSIATAVATKSNSADAYFIPSCFQHPTYPTAVTGYNATVSGQQAATVFSSWYTALSAGSLSASTISSYRLADVSNYLPLAGCSATPAYSLAAAPVTTPSVRGDPQFVGLRGQSFQVHGIDGAVYNLITEFNTQVNSRFVFLTGGVCPTINGVVNTVACWSHPGSYMGDMSFQVVVDGKLHAALVTAGDAKKGFSAVQVDGKTLMAGESVSFGGFALHYNNSHSVYITLDNYHVDLTNSDMFLNLALTATVPLSQLQSHGLIGQTWSTRRHASSLKVIEGEVDDYVVAEGDVFGTSFVYNRFQA